MNMNEFIQAAQTKCFEKYGVFFAFSTAQFDEQKKPEHFPYVRMGMGLICPKANKDAFLKAHKAIVSGGIAKDIKKNGKDAIIKRQLFNYECTYTNDISDVVEALEDYGFTHDDIRKVFNEMILEKEAM